MTTVTTQAELDKAIKASDRDIIINSPRGVWLEVSGSASVRAFGSASVRAFGSASVSAFDSASVSAFDSASVSASGSASVRASDSASVSAFDSASVRAFGSASVSAFGSASVRASDSASVSAFGSASVRAFDSASVRASAYVAVHLHSALATVEGGVVIDVTGLDLKDPKVWAEYTGCELLLADDGRGYKLGYRAGYYEAGCRVFTFDEAVAHWSNPRHERPPSAALLLEAVQTHQAALKAVAA